MSKIDQHVSRIKKPPFLTRLLTSLIGVLSKFRQTNSQSKTAEEKFLMLPNYNEGHHINLYEVANQLIEVFGFTNKQVHLSSNIVINGMHVNLVIQDIDSLVKNSLLVRVERAEALYEIVPTHSAIISTDHAVKLHNWINENKIWLQFGSSECSGPLSPFKEVFDNAKINSMTEKEIWEVPMHKPTTDMGMAGLLMKIECGRLGTRKLASINPDELAIAEDWALRLIKGDTVTIDFDNLLLDKEGCGEGWLIASVVQVNSEWARIGVAVSSKGLEGLRKNFGVAFDDSFKGAIVLVQYMDFDARTKLHTAKQDIASLLGIGFNVIAGRQSPPKFI